MLALPHELFDDHELCHMATIQLGVSATEILGRWDIGILVLTECETLNSTSDFVLYRRHITRRELSPSYE